MFVLDQLSNHTDIHLCVCVFQETHLTPEEQFNMKGYEFLCNDITPNIRARRYYFSYQHISRSSHTASQAVPYRLLQPQGWLPDVTWQAENLQNLIEKLSPLLFLVADYNVNSCTWCCNGTNIAGFTDISPSNNPTHKLLCHGLENVVLSFTFVLCPGHACIQENEETDAVARNAAYSQKYMQLPNDCLLYTSRCV